MLSAGEMEKNNRRSSEQFESVLCNSLTIRGHEPAAIASAMNAASCHGARRGVEIVDAGAARRGKFILVLEQRPRGQ